MREVAPHQGLAETDGTSYHVLSLVKAKQGKPEEALSNAVLAVQHDPALADAQLHLGSLQTEAGQFAEAEASFKRLVELAPDGASGHRGLAVVYEKQDRLPEAERTLREGLTRQAADPGLLSQLGKVRIKQKDFREAEQLLVRAMRTGAPDSGLLNSLGWAQLQLNKTYDAEQNLRQSLAVEPGNVLAQNNIGVLFAKTNRPLDARQAFSRALSLDPSNENARRNLEALGKK